MNQSGTSYESSLLLTLGEITQLVVHSRDAAETLTNIVRLIQGRFHTAVCSVASSSVVLYRLQSF